MSKTELQQKVVALEKKCKSLELLLERVAEKNGLKIIKVDNLIYGVSDSDEAADEFIEMIKKRPPTMEQLDPSRIKPKLMNDEIWRGIDFAQNQNEEGDVKEVKDETEDFNEGIKFANRNKKRGFTICRDENGDIYTENTVPLIVRQTQVAVMDGLFDPAYLEQVKKEHDVTYC